MDESCSGHSGWVTLFLGFMLGWALTILVLDEMRRKLAAWAAAAMFLIELRPDCDIPPLEDPEDYTGEF